MSPVFYSPNLPDLPYRLLIRKTKAERMGMTLTVSVFRFGNDHRLHAQRLGSGATFQEIAPLWWQRVVVVPIDRM